jgi:hypothetical protein
MARWVLSEPDRVHAVNLSRAWMLEGIASGLPEDDARRAELGRIAKVHGAAGMGALASEEDSLTHWIASFATYFVTRRGVETNGAAA